MEVALYSVCGLASLGNAVAATDYVARYSCQLDVGCEAGCWRHTAKSCAVSL